MEQSRDDGDEPRPPKPCCMRMQTSRGIAWCHLEEGHVALHTARIPRELPINTFMPKGKR